MGVRAGELGVALTYGRGRNGGSGIEIRDARAVDAGGIVELERLCIGELELERGLWHPVAQVLRECCALAIGIAATHVAVLIAQACTG